jgi:nitrogen regulatory protein PII
MKIISIIVHEAAKQNILDSVAGINNVKGCYLYKVDGYFEGVGNNPFETQKDLVDGYTPRLRIDILVEKDVVSEVMDNIFECTSCVKGRGVWYTRDIEDWGLM